MPVKRLIHLMVLYGGLLFLLTACHSDYLHINYKAFHTSWSGENETEVAFVLNTSAYLKAKGISQFPDGGKPKYLHRSIGLFMLNPENKQLSKMVSFDDLVYGNYNFPNSIKTKITLSDTCIYYQITPITDWDVYLKWCENSSDSIHINSLKEKYLKHYKVRISDKQIFIVDSAEFTAAFNNKSPYSLTNLNALLDNIPLEKMGLQVMNIYPKSEAEYIDETIYLKNESVLARRAVIEQIISKHSKDEIKLMLKRMDEYKNSLEGYDKTRFEQFSKETYMQIQALL